MLKGRPELLRNPPPQCLNCDNWLIFKCKQTSGVTCRASLQAFPLAWASFPCLPTCPSLTPAEDCRLAPAQNSVVAGFLQKPHSPVCLQESGRLRRAPPIVQTRCIKCQAFEKRTISFFKVNHTQSNSALTPQNGVKSVTRMRLHLSGDRTYWGNLTPHDCTHCKDKFSTRSD
jgi:hypothetical protein